MTEKPPQWEANVETSNIGGETLVVNGDEIHVLNETAAFIWRLCDGRHTPVEIEAALREEYAVPSDRDVAADIARTLADLRSKGLLAES
jgi:hypothetical protein